MNFVFHKKPEFLIWLNYHQLVCMDELINIIDSFFLYFHFSQKVGFMPVPASVQY
jgi:hypothetical protein